MKKSIMVGRRALVVLAVAVAALTPMTLVGCGSSSADDAAAEQAGQAEPEATQAEPEAAQSEYAVSIDGTTLTTDYQGAPAVIVDYTFTNNSEKATSFAVACSPKVFQNGVQLETAITTDDLGNGYMAEIKSGASTTARLAYSLSDESDITVEVEELFSLDDALLAEATFSVA